ncbi:MAG: TonB family protein [Dokdonella sp.]|nr:TonB family protein [Dokdonella sp.]MCB1575116.1 TonB family protein [Xanthomonadales bacterium]
MNLIAGNLLWVQTLGWTLIHFVWQGLVIGTLFAGIRTLVPREQGSVRYAVGLLALVMLALCPLLTFCVLWPQAEAGAVEAVSAPLVVQAVAIASVKSVESASPFSAMLPLLVIGWMAGVSFMIWRAVHQWRALERIATRLAYRRAELEEILLRVAERFGGMPGVRVLVSGFIDTPTLIGWFKPVILLPAAVVSGFPREQLELILAHELGHLRRYDHFVNLGQAVLETLLFYHPVVHWISREVRHEREVCCDNLVLRLTDSEPRKYALTLAALEEVRQLTPQLSLAASGGMLLDRVRRIVGSKSLLGVSRRPHRSAWLVVAMSTCLVVAMAVVSQSGEPGSTEPFERPSLAFESPAPQAQSLAFGLAAPMPVAFAALPELTPRIDAAAATGAGEVPVVAEVEPRSTAEVPPNAPAAELPVLPPPATPELSPVALQVGDVDIAQAEPLPAAMATDPAENEQPTILRRVAPDYANPRAGEQDVMVGFEFAIDASGKVRDIRVVSGERSSRFAAAARRALSQWEFDPRSVTAGSSTKFRQDFEFVATARAASADEATCTPPIGSHVCRPVRGTGTPITRTIERESRTVAQASADTNICTPPTGSLVCRPIGPAGPSEPNGHDEATMAHLIVLAGGSP